MITCSNGHEDIVYDGKYCPVCELMMSLQSALDNLNDANREVDNLRDRCLELEDEVAELSKQISDLERE